MDYRAQFDGLEAREGRDRAEIKLIDRHFDLEFVWRLATHPRVLDAVEAVIGPNLILLASHLAPINQPLTETVAPGLRAPAPPPHP